jgi:plasmid stabilization system protein ParE
MNYSLVLKEEAVSDIQQAFNFYNNAAPDLGTRFLDELENHFDDITQRPLSYSFWLDQNLYRSYSLKHFPFSIIFEVSGEVVIVFAVHDHRRHPDETIKRF